MTHFLRTRPRRASAVKHSAAVQLTAAGAAVIFLLRCSAAELHVAVPLVVVIGTAVFFWCWLWRREREIPAFEVGSLFMLASVAYIGFPLISYLLSGMRYTIYSSSRFLEVNPGPVEMGGLAWEAWSFVAAFAVSYLVVRGRVPRVRTRPLAEVPASTGVALAILWGSLTLWAAFLKYRFGVDYSVGYGDMAAHATGVASLPHWLSQIEGIALGLQGVLPIALAVYLVSRWRRRWARVLLACFLLYTLIWYVFFNMGSRTILFIPFAAGGLMYLRVVRPATLRMVAIVLAIFLSAFWGFNEMRSGDTMEKKFDGLKSLQRAETPAERYSRKDEFQLWFSNNLEVRNLAKASVRPEIPWQIYAIDPLLIIPSQLLPFEKIDPQAWFSDYEFARTGIFEFFVFSPISQGYIGFGVPEIILRGLFLGSAFALLHRAYVRHSSRFFANTAYLWLILSCYTSLRNNTGYVFAVAVMRLTPFILMLSILRWALSARRPNSMSAPTLTLSDPSRYPGGTAH